MEHIAEITGTLCVAVVIMGILYNIGCFTATEKVIKFVISVFIILTVIKSADIGTIRFDTQWKEESIMYSNSIDYKEYLISQTEKKLEDEIKNRLAEKNIAYNHLSVHILEQNNLLTADRIVVNCNADMSEVKEIVKDIITEDTEIVMGE